MPRSLWHAFSKSLVAVSISSLVTWHSVSWVIAVAMRWTPAISIRRSCRSVLPVWETKKLRCSNHCDTASQHGDTDCVSRSVPTCRKAEFKCCVGSAFKIQSQPNVKLKNAMAKMYFDIDLEARTCEAWFQLTFRPQKWNLKAHLWYQLSPFPSSNAAIAMQHHPGNIHQSVATPRYSATPWYVLINTQCNWHDIETMAE